MADTGPMGPGNGGNIPRPSCDSPQCQSALGAVATDRNRVLSKCAQVEATKSRRDTLAAIAGALLALGVALLIGAGAATATVFGIPLAVILFWAAVTVIATAILFGLFALIAGIQYAVQQGELNAERARFTDDASKVTMACPSNCWGDLTLPACPD
jgi:fatty acid desaturase